MHTETPIRIVLVAGIEGVHESMVHEDGAPKVADIALSRAQLQVLVNAGHQLADPAAAGPSIAAFAIHANTPFAFPSFRGGAHVYTTTGEHSDTDPLAGHEQAQRGATVELRAEPGGTVYLRVLADPADENERGCLASEKIELAELVRLHNAASALGVPFAFSRGALEEAVTWELFEEGAGPNSSPNYSAYDEVCATNSKYAYTCAEEAADLVLHEAQGRPRPHAEVASPHVDASATSNSTNTAPNAHSRNVVIHSLYWTRLDGIEAGSDSDAIARALHRMGEVMAPGTGIPQGLPFGPSDETPYFVVEQVDIDGIWRSKTVYGEDGCEPATPQRAALDAAVAAAVPEPRVGSYDRGFRDALESVVAHVATTGAMTHLQARELVETVLEAFGNNAPEDDRNTLLVIGENGAQGEPTVRTVAAFPDLESAEDYRTDCWESSRCMTAEPVAIPTELQAHRRELVEVVEAVLHAANAFQPGPRASTTRSPSP